jgi:ribosomal protein S27AE
MAKSKMLCPKCGDEMNHHADKLVYEVDNSRWENADLGGVIEETHACPGCGAVASRRQANNCAPGVLA